MRSPTRVPIPLLALLAGCTMRADPHAADLLDWTDCRVRGHSRVGQCATLRVPEDPAAPAGRQLDLRVARFPSSARSPEPDPLLLLAGGPGQAGTEALGPIVGSLLKVRASRDVVFVDPRGAGQSSPIPCETDDVDPVLLLAGPPELVAAEAARMRACRDAFPGDLGHYGTRDLVADLERVREALGVERWNVWGGSYGTRLAQEYARTHPDRVRSLVLDGVVPPASRPVADAAAAADRAVRDTLAACTAEPACAAAFPDLGPRWDALRARLDAEPLAAVVHHPRTNAPVAVSLDGDTVGRLARLLAYIPESAAWLPVVVDRLDAGDPGPLLAGLMPLVTDLGRMTNPMLQLAVTCPEDGPRLGPADLAVPGVAAAVEICSDWPAGEVDPARVEPLRSDVPALLLSGGLDPVTPPANAEEVARTLSHATLVVAAGYGHGITHQGCASELVVRFLDDLDAHAFSADCLALLADMPRPAFPISATGLSP